MINKEEIIEWAMEDGYSEEEATKAVLEATTIQTITNPITAIIYSNGVKDFIYKDENGKIIHLNPYKTREK